MPRKTSYEELYTTIGNLVERASGRSWWRKAKIQTRPSTPYATVYLTEGEGIEKPVVENLLLDEPTENGEWYQQTPWGTTYLDIRVEFFVDGSGDSVLQAAKRTELALHMEERFFDIWDLCALNGSTRIIDISSIFREDIEPRAELRFSVIANIADPPPLADKDLFDINSQQVNVTHVSIDGTETEQTITVDDDES